MVIVNRHTRCAQQSYAKGWMSSSLDEFDSVGASWRGTTHMDVASTAEDEVIAAKPTHGTHSAT